MSKGSLVLYLKRAGAISGPYASKPTRHSDLSLIKSWLLGIPISFGYKAHNNFGSATHHLFLLGRWGKFKLTAEEKKRILGMINSLNSNPAVRKIMALCPVREKRRGAILNQTKIKLTPDAHGQRIMMDLKTTICSNLEEFVDSAIEYGYFRQGKTYSLAVGTKEYWIVGIQKEPPYRVFLVLINGPEYRETMRYVEQELAFLLYFYKNYGNPNYKKQR